MHSSEPSSGRPSVLTPGRALDIHGADPLRSFLLMATSQPVSRCTSCTVSPFLALAQRPRAARGLSAGHVAARASRGPIAGTATFAGRSRAARWHRIARGPLAGTPFRPKLAELGQMWTEFGAKSGPAAACDSACPCSSSGLIRATSGSHLPPSTTSHRSSSGRRLSTAPIAVHMTHPSF